MTRRLLAIAGVYLVGYELVKATVVEQVQGFFMTGWSEESGFVIDEAYGRDVVAGHKHELDGCLAWLVRADVLSLEEAASVGRLRDARNRIAHEMTDLLVEPRYELDLQAAIAARVVLKRLAVFFGGIDVDTDPYVDDAEVDYEGIESGVSLLYAHLLQAAFLDEEQDANQETEGK